MRLAAEDSESQDDSGRGGSLLRSLPDFAPTPPLGSHTYGTHPWPILVPSKQPRNYATNAFAERFVYVKTRCIMYAASR